jgi:hypothetical protein
LLKALTGMAFFLFIVCFLIWCVDSGFHTPTMVQNSAIPLLLQGKDVLIKVCSHCNFYRSFLGTHWQWQDIVLFSSFDQSTLATLENQFD